MLPGALPRTSYIHTQQLTNYWWYIQFETRWTGLNIRVRLSEYLIEAHCSSGTVKK